MHTTRKTGMAALLDGLFKLPLEMLHIYRSPPTAKVCSQLWQFLATMLESQQRNRKQRSSKLHSTKRELPMPEAPITIHLVQVWIIVPDVYISV